MACFSPKISNAQQQAFRAKKSKEEKEADIRMITAIVERERMQDKLDKEKLEK